MWFVHVWMYYKLTEGRFWMCQWILAIMQQVFTSSGTASVSLILLPVVLVKFQWFKSSRIISEQIISLTCGFDGIIIIFTERFSFYSLYIQQRIV